MHKLVRNLASVRKLGDLLARYLLPPPSQQQCVGQQAVGDFWEVRNMYEGVICLRYVELPRAIVLACSPNLQLLLL